ncbi:hypothetical protein [Bacillus sp. EB600]|uniref:hypothetical protein n=1 Tax=Bacillus sp. EB600 TaxID=2806345 RepID=UPI00210DA8D4|nr:hypothetical protein [Bacillus sp. EB600]MCQ6281650.1 hypothetical protein [Bacillus sp. EB600]
MNVVSVRIKYSFWDFNTEISRVGEKLVYEGVFRIDIDISELEEKLCKLIMNDKHDGMTIEVNSFNDLHFMEIDLFLGEPGDTYDINYIIKFLSQFKKLDKLPSTNDLSNYQGFIYLKYSDEVEEALNIIRSCGLNAEKIGMTTFKYERGASDLWESFILGIASSVAWDSIKFVKAKLQEKFNNHYRDLQFGTFNAQRLKENVAHLLGEAPQNLEMVSFECIEGDRFLVTFNSRYQKVFVESTDSGTIIKMNTEKETQTRI